MFLNDLAMLTGRIHATRKLKMSEFIRRWIRYAMTLPSSPNPTIDKMDGELLPHTLSVFGCATGCLFGSVAPQQESCQLLNMAT